MLKVDFYMPEYVCCGFYLSSKRQFICVWHSAGGPRLHNTDLEQSLLNSCCWDSALGPVPEHFVYDIFPAACGVWFVKWQMWCMHGVSSLAYSSSGCVTASSNLRQQHPLPLPPFTTMSYLRNHSLLATDLWMHTSCGAEIAIHKNALDVTAKLPCHFHLPH